MRYAAAMGSAFASAVLQLFTVCYLAKTDAWQFRPPSYSTHNGMDRRQLIQKSLSSAALVSCCFLPTSPAAAAAAAAEEEKLSYAVDPFSFELPKSWKVIVNSKKPGASSKKPSDGKVFSAIDFGTGAVLTVVEENICSPAEYAANVKQCDILASSNSNNAGASLPFSSPEILPKDVSKLLIRHDDRDNAALQGTTSLESVEVISNDKTVSAWNIFATTNLPSGGTYRDTMGLDQPNMLARKTKVVKADDGHIVSLWFTVPTDDWNKPTTGLKLREIWKSVMVNKQ